MKKTDIGIGIGVGLAVVTLVGVGVWFGVTHLKHGQKLSSLSTDVAGASQSANAAAPTSDSTSLNPVSSGNNSGSSLSVGGNASNLGQLGGSQKASSGQGGASSSFSGTQAPSPDQFGQYEKYKTATGALFGDMQVGNGDELTANKKAAVLYKGWLTNGQMFDQSKPGSDGKLQPFVFTLGAHQVIPGWEQGLAGMKVGGSRLVIVPPSVGYGDQAQSTIPPNSVLVFEVQLLAVQ